MKPALNALIAIFILATSCFAVTLTVTKTADTSDGHCSSDCSRREALAASNTASSDNAISFDATVFAGAQTSTLLLGELTITNNVRLTIGGAGANLRTISGKDTSRVFNNASGANTSVTDQTLNFLVPTAGGRD